MSDDYEIRYVPLRLDQVIRDFADRNLKVQKGEALHRVEWYVDTAKGYVVFAIGVTKRPTKREA